MPALNLLVNLRVVSLTILLLLLGAIAFGQVQQVNTATPVPSNNTALETAVNQHGGNAVRAVSRMELQGQSARPGGTMPVTIYADLSGSIRLDYGSPVSRSIINTAEGSSEIVNGKLVHKPPHVGVFAQLDALGIFGLLRLETASVTWTDLGPVAVAGNAAISRRADTGKSQQEYRRMLPDLTDIRFDVATGLVSSITRTQYAEKSVDFSASVTYIFSDYRTVNNIVVPFRIDQYLGGTLVETITISSFNLNPSFSTTIFER